MMKKSFTLGLLALLLAVMAPNTGRADTLTVANGNSNCNSVPFLLYSLSTYLHSQTVYPASMLQEMTGGEITSLTWYFKNLSSAPLGMNIVLRIAEVNTDNSGTQFANVTLTEVYNGNFDGMDSATTFVFDQPYAYGGGSLVVDMYNTTFSQAGFMDCVRAAGVSSAGASLYEYSYTSVCPSQTPTTVNDMPKISFGYSLGDVGSCPRPQTLTVGDVAEDGFTLTWSAAAGASSYIVYLGDEVYTTTSDTTADVTGLVPNTPYSMSVVTDCGEEQSLPIFTNTRTLCSTSGLTPPWSEDFADAGSLNCWTLADGDGDGSSWALFEGSLVGYYGNSGPADNWAITPLFTLADEQDNALLAWDVNGSVYLGDYTHYEVRLAPGSSGTDTAAFTTVLFSETFNDTTVDQWLHRSVDLAAYAGQSFRIAFRHNCDDDAMLIDNLLLTTADIPTVSLDGPDAVDLGGTGFFAAVLESGDPASIAYTWTSARMIDGEATITVTDSTAAITYLAGDYDTVTVTAANSFGSASATIIVRLRDCSAIDSLPWSEDFASALSLDCWKIIDADADGTTWTNMGLSAPYGYLRAPFGAAADDWAVTPPIVIPTDADGLLLCWDDWFAGTAAIAARYEVRVSPTGSYAAADFTDSLFSVSGDSPTWTQRRLSMADYGGQTVRVAFRHVADADDGGLRLRNVTMRMAREPMAAISGPTIVELGDSAIYGATLVEGLSDDISYTWSSAMAAAGLATATTAEDTLGVIYAAIGTDTVRLVIQNSYGADTALLVVNVRDLAAVGALPYSTSFEDAADNTHWQFESNNTTNRWVADTAVANGGSMGLYVSNTGGATNSYHGGISTLAYAWRAFDLTEAGDYSLQFDWKAYGEANDDFMRVFVVPLGTTLPTSYTAIKHNQLPAGYIAADGGNQLNLDEEWQTENMSFTVDSAGVYQLVFCWRNDAMISHNPPAAVDNVTVDRLTCRSPLGLTADSLGSGYVAFHWTPAGNATQWEVRLNGENPVVTTDSHYVATGINASTSYTVSVRSVCGEGDTSVATEIIMATNCGAIANFPWSEGFEGRTTGVSPDCWTPTVAYSSANHDYPVVYGTVASAHGGERYLYNEIRGDSVYVLTATPILATPANTLRGSVWVKGYCAYYTENLTTVYDEIEVEVGVMTDPDDASTFVPIFDTSMDVREWTELTFSAEACGIGTHAALAFRSTLSLYGIYGYFHIDDLTVYNDGTPTVPAICDIPTNLHAVLTTPTAVTIDWTPGGDEETWDIEYNGQTISAGGHPYVVSGLTAETAYSFRLRAVCGDGFYSDWTDALNVTTPADGEEPGDTTGIDATEASAFSLHPNPATSSVTIAAAAGSHIDIVDLNGRTVVSTETKSSTSELNVAGLARGAYFVRIVNGSGVGVRKLVLK